MTKKIIQDIYRADKKKENISTNYPVVASEPSKKFSFSEKLNNRKSIISSTPRLRQKKGKGPYKYILAVFFLISMIAGSYLYFGRVEIDVVSKKIQIELKDELIIAHKGQDAKPGFEVMIIDDVIEKKVSFSESVSARSKSSGRVRLINNYSEKSEKIPAKTIFVDDYGKEYLIEKDITIPGYKKSGNRIVSGQIETVLTATAYGEGHNTDSKNFLIKKFNQNDKYTKIYAETITPVSGGLDGDYYALSSVEKGKIEAELNSVYKDYSYRRLQAQVPPGYIFYPNISSYSYAFDGDTKSKERESNIEVGLSIKAVIFNKQDMEQAIASKNTSSSDEKDLAIISIPDIDKLKVSFSDKNQQISKNLIKLNLLVSGIHNAVWNPNPFIIKESVLGMSSDDARKLILGYLGVVDVKIRKVFYFSNKIPDDMRKITVDIQ
jgi:hypothetical protein